MIIYRKLVDELTANDELYCGSCSAHTLRAALEQAAARGDRNFLICENCRERWVPDVEIDAVARAWTLIFVTGSPLLAAVLCADCAASHPDPVVGLPEIARLVLARSRRGPMQ